MVLGMYMIISTYDDRNLYCSDRVVEDVSCGYGHTAAVTGIHTYMQVYLYTLCYTTISTGCVLLG